MTGKQWHQMTVRNPDGKTFDVLVDDPDNPTYYKVYEESTTIRWMSNLKPADSKSGKGQKR